MSAVAPPLASASPAAPAVRLAPLLMLASGFAGLGYQIVWTQQGGLWLGHEAAAVLAVVTAFFGGLALGAASLGARLARSAHPARGYALCETVIAAWSIGLAAFGPSVGEALLQLIGPRPSAAWQWTVAFAGTFVLLLPATAAMGATLPALERALAGLRTGPPGARSHVAGLYAANTFGAVLGVLACAFWLVPELGLVRTALVCAAMNLGCAAIALGWPQGAAADADKTRSVEAASPADQRLPLLLFLTGLLGIGFEVLAVRVLSQVAENTVYTFALLLAVYLVGTALGAAAWQRIGRQARSAGWTDEGLLGLLTAAVSAGVLALWICEAVKTRLTLAWGPGLLPALTAEAVLAALVFLLPTVAMGAVFSRLSERALDRGLGFGAALALNTAGAAAAPLVFGVLLLPALGAKGAVLCLIAGYALLAVRSWRSPLAWGAALALGVAAIALPRLAFIDLPEGAGIVFYEEGPTASVSIVQDRQGVARLRIDNRQQEGSNATLLADARQALLPLLLHPAPRRALFLGLGTGVTANAAAADARLEVDAVELLPEVIDASAFFTQAVLDGPPNPRLHLLQADARRFVRTATQRYDLIVADNFHPARSGSGALYTVEHFRAVRERLTEDGLFVQWLPLHQMDLLTLRSIVQAYRQAFPQGGALLATLSLDTPVIGLVSRADGRPLALPAVRERIGQADWPRPPADYGLDDEWAVAGSLIAGPSALARFAGDAPLNTDDRPVVAYRAPAATYAPEARPRDRLFALLRELDVQPGELFTADSAPAQRRLADYRAARDRFLLAGREVRLVADPRQMLAQIREPLLAVLATSADFRPAYDPLLRLASALSSSDPAAARDLLSSLQRLQPARREAAERLAPLDGR